MNFFIYLKFKTYKASCLNLPFTKILNYQFNKSKNTGKQARNLLIFERMGNNYLTINTLNFSKLALVLI